jgi:2-oxo-4-hydroxy-4-carboxy-5-ureidoimidazoline decarboxylase
VTLEELNALPADDAKRAFFACCGSTRWAAVMAARRPFASVEALMETADAEWRALEPHAWREAFSHHPRIGDRAAAGAAKHEQAGAQSAAAATLRELESLNRKYEEKFGFVFLIFASGRSADEMLDALKTRIWNREDVELRNAVGEQAKIMRLRLEKLLR